MDLLNQRVAALACYNFGGYTGPMVLELKLRKVGNSLGVVLPKEALARLNASEGDIITLTQAPDGSLRVTAGNHDFNKKMAVAEGLMKRYRNALRELAK